MDIFRLSKTVSHALRHEPWLYELELDDQGSVPVEELLKVLRTQRVEWDNLSQNDIVQMIKKSSKKRYEINGDCIRSLYGHSLSGKLEMKKAVPPEQLFHGTASQTAKQIINEGLLPMGRQYVHLSVNIDIAKQVGGRKDKNPVILRIHAKEAYSNGVYFYVGNDVVWLANFIPQDFIDIS